MKSYVGFGVQVGVGARTSADSSYNLGLVLQRTSRIAEAESEYRRTLELMPGFTDAQDRLKEVRPK